LSKQKKIDKKNNKIEDEAEEKFDQKRREVWSKTKRKKSFFKSRIQLHLIFVFFTTHFRIHHLRFTTFLSHETWSFSMNFRKNHKKNLIWFLNRSKWSSSRFIMRKTSISCMKDAWFLAWKKTFTIVNDNRHFHNVFSLWMRTRNVIFISSDWIKRFIVKENSKNQASNSFEREIQ
jgi:hypothetical protein